MKGYITVVTRTDGAAYRAKIVDLPTCTAHGPTVAEVLANAEANLRRLSDEGTDLPPPRPSVQMISEVAKHKAVAGACLRARRAA